MRKYITIAELEARDPDWAARVRARDYAKKVRLRLADPENTKQTNRREYETYRRARARWMVNNTRQEARRKGVDCDISVEWVQARLDAGTCELSGIAFDLDGDRRNRPSVDRRLPGGDYVESNCRLIVMSLNCILARGGDAAIPKALNRLQELREGA